MQCFLTKINSCYEVALNHNDMVLVYLILLFAHNQVLLGFLMTHGNMFLVGDCCFPVAQSNLNIDSILFCYVLCLLLTTLWRTRTY